MTREQRFWAKVDTSAGILGCWPWTARRDRHGYGQLTIGGRHGLKAHRVAWTLTNGPIPIGLHVLHACDSPHCCNPAHLWLGTHADNMADMVVKGRARNTPSRGEANPKAKLTVRDIPLIRALSANGMTHAALSRQFGVGPTAIRNLLTGATWRSVA